MNGTTTLMSLPESLERAAGELAALADKIRPANGDPHRLLEDLDPAEASRLLVWILAEAPGDAAELLEAWGEEERGVEVLLGVPDDRLTDGLTKEGRKLLRKARHRLRTQGVAEAAQSAPAPVRRTIAKAPDRWQAAHVSEPDFRGARIGYLVDRHPSGGARLFEIRFDEARGVREFKVYNAGRSKVRGFLKSLTSGSGQRLLEVDRDALRALVWRASRAQPSDRPLPTGFVEWRSRLFPDELEKQATPGELAREALGEGSLEAGLEAAIGEIREGELGPWPPPTSWVGDRMELGREAVRGLEGEARSAAIEAWIEETTDALAADTASGPIARHLEELAWIRWQGGDDDGARGLLALSSALADSDEGATRRITRARVESLFELYLDELRVVESPALED